MGWLLRIPADDHDRADAVASRLWDLGTTGLWAADGSIVAGFDDRQMVERAAAVIDGAVIHGTAIDGMVIERAPELDHWQPEGRPSPVVVDDGTGGSVTIQIAPGPTFGHGGHPTTRLVLDRLGRLVTTEVEVLDVGTGSGVLAVAAAVLGASRVTGIDIDPKAIEVAAANGAANRVSITWSTESAAALTRSVPAFDLIVVNVLAPVHRALGPQLVRALRPGGRVVTSGYLVDQADQVVGSYPGLAPMDDVRGDGDWLSHVLVAG